MEFVLLWIVVSALIFGLGYSFGREAGFRQGRRRGFERALHHAIQTQRPLEALRRILVPSRDQ